MASNSTGWADEHRNAVADRWKVKYQRSGMTEKEFSEYMKKTMLKYGWSEVDANRMVKRATKI